MASITNILAAMHDAEAYECWNDKELLASLYGDDNFDDVMAELPDADYDPREINDQPEPEVF